MKVNTLGLCLAVASLTFVPFKSQAEDISDKKETKARVVVVTANRVDTPIEQVASSISIVSGEELEARHITNVGEALRGVAGVDVVRSGPVGGNSAVFLRGANSEHTLVLIDGVEVNDPVSPTRAFNFSDLSTDNIQQIEILRGPQSTLYGSDALGGVINVITKKGDGAPHAFASAEAGSYDTYVERAGLSGSQNSMDYSLGFTQENSHSISAANQKYGNEEDDGYKNTAFSTRLGFEPSDILRFNFTTRYNHSNAELDNSGGVGVDDPNRTLKHEQFFTRFEALTSFFEGKLKQTFGMGYSDQWFRDNNDIDAMHPSDTLRSRYVGRLLKFDWLNNVALNDWMNLIVGIETEEERGSSNYFSDGDFGPFNGDFDPRTARSNGYFAQTQVAADQFFATAGVRVDDHSRFGSEVSWKVAPGYRVESTGTKISGSVGTGFKAPSLFQLYSSYGNPDLEPEKSIGVDGGIEQQILGDKLAAGITYFWNNFHDLITFNPNTFVSENIARARTQGIEASLSSRPCEDLSLRLSYTLMRTEDRDTDEQLLRRPKNKVGADANYQFSEKGNVNLNLVLVGKRVDNDFSTFPAARVTMPTYVTLNAAANYEVHKNVELFVRLDNLFDRDYEEVLGYGTRGAAAYAGVKLKL